MYKKRKLIFGVGVNDWPSSVYPLNKQIKEYQVWTSMLSRCFNQKEKDRSQTYVDSYCSKDWLLFSNFVKDIRGMVGFDLLLSSDWQLDKDLLIKGNKLYSNETCCLLPKDLNVAITKRDAKRGDYPIGVHTRENKNLSNKFVATVSYKGRNIHLGYFSNEFDAHMAYKKKKEEILKSYADEFYGLIDDRAFNALKNYYVDIND